MPDSTTCPDPSVHGNPFRYCPHCDWTEGTSTPPTARTAGSLTADDLGRTVTVEGVLAHVSPYGAGVVLRARDVGVVLRAATPVHVHDEEAGRG